MQDSKLVAERTKEWHQLVSKVNRAYFTTSGILRSANSLGGANMAISPKGKRQSWAREFKRWIGVLRMLGRKLQDMFLGEKVCPRWPGGLPITNYLSK